MRTRTLVTPLLAHGVLASQCPSADPGFNVDAVADLAASLSSHSWEYGTAAQALLEYYDPDYAVFSSSAFPQDKLPTPPDSIRSLSYAKPHISTDGTTFIDGDGAAGDPCSLGVSAILLGTSDQAYADAATSQAEHILTEVPRMPNGAISQREDNAEAWADWMYMVPPFLAYQAVATGNVSLLQETVTQLSLYRDILGSDGAAWQHIVPGPDGSNNDDGRWSTGNGWAALGIARVLATIAHWGPAAELGDECDTLVGLMKQIFDAARSSPRDSNGLLRNYLPDESWFGEASGTSALTAAVYRAAVLRPDDFGEYVDFATELRQAMAGAVDENGKIAPTVNPLGWGDREPDYSGSPEGQSFGVMVGASWRDCVCAGVCQA